jgi:hypothetical protein
MNSDDESAKALYGKISVGFVGAGMMATAIMVRCYCCSLLLPKEMSESRL